MDCDLLRVWSDTEAWHARMKGEEEVNIQKPLYQVNTFTSKQVRTFFQKRDIHLSNVPLAFSTIRSFSKRPVLLSFSHITHVSYREIGCFYFCEQVTSDPRYKLEQRLREAGLHNNAYARQVMMNTQGPQPPRRDMQSTVFKQ